MMLTAHLVPKWDTYVSAWVNKVSSGVLMLVSNQEPVRLSEAGNKIRVERGLLS